MARPSWGSRRLARSRADSREEDGAQAQAAADGLLDQFDALDGDRAVGGGLGLGEGAAKVFDQRVLAAGDGAEALVRRVGKGLGHAPPARAGVRAM